MAKVARPARPTSLPKKKSHAPTQPAARAGGIPVAMRHQEASRTASSPPGSAVNPSKSEMPAQPRPVKQSVFLRPVKNYAKDHPKSSPKANRIQRTTPGHPNFNVKNSPSSKSANRLQSSPLDRSNASVASSKKTERSQDKTRYSISDLEMNSPISIPSDDSSDDMPGGSGMDSKDSPKTAQAALKSSEPVMAPVQTFLRLRPPHPAAADQEESLSYVDVLSSTDVLMSPPPNARSKTPSKYTFTKVFDPTATQTDVFKDTCAPLLTPLLREDDYSAVLFAYGVSASGKTHSIIGSNIPKQAGILPRALDVVFKSIKANATDSGEASQYRPVGYRDVEKVDPAGLGQSTNSDKNHRHQIKAFRRMVHKSSKTIGLEGHTASFEIPTHGGGVDYDSNAISLPKGMDYTVWLSCAELFSEKIFDLLEDPLPGTQSLMLSAMGTKRKELYLKKDKSTGHRYIDGLKEVEVRTLEEALLVLSAALGRRRVYSKLLNKYSSRSHCIFTIKVLKTPEFGSSATEDASKGKTSVGRLSIVDLAGPERFQGTKNTGQRQEKAGNTNTSLMVLGHCMQVLRTNQTTSSKIPQSVPFRHSILTQLFQCALEGRSASTRVALLIHSDSHGNMFDETTQALRFASTPVDVSTPSKDVQQSFRDMISDLYEKIGAMEREREMVDEEIKAAVIEQVKNELLGEMTEKLRKERVETVSTASQTSAIAVMDMSTQTPTSTFADATPPVTAPNKLVSATSVTSLVDMSHPTVTCTFADAAPPVTAPTKLVSLRETSPLTGQDGSDEEHATAGLVSEINRLQRLLEEANQQVAAWQSWHLSAPCSAPLTAPRTAASPCHTRNEIALRPEEEPADTEDQLCVAVYQTRPALIEETVEQDHPMPMPLGKVAAEDGHDDEGEATTMDHTLGAADHVGAIPIQNCDLPLHSQTTPDAEDHGMQSTDAVDADPQSLDEGGVVNEDGGKAVSSNCLTDLDPAEHPARDSASGDKHEDTTAETNDGDNDELMDEEYHIEANEESEPSPRSSPRQTPPPRPQGAVAAETPIGLCADNESSQGSSPELVLEDREAQQSVSIVLKPFFSRSTELVKDFRDVSPADEPEPTTFTPAEEPDQETGVRPRYSFSYGSYWGFNPFNPKEGAKQLTSVKEYENVRDCEDVQEHENVPQNEDVKEHEDVPQHEDVKEHKDVRQHEELKEHEDVGQHEELKEHEDVGQHEIVKKHENIKDYLDGKEHGDVESENVEDIQTVGDYEDVEQCEVVKDSEDVEKLRDVREYEDVSPAEDPLPETFAPDDSPPRSRSGSPYWDASSLSPQVIAEEFEEPEPEQHNLDRRSPPPRSPARQTPPPPQTPLPPAQTPLAQPPPAQTPPAQTSPAQTPPRYAPPPPQTPPRRSRLDSPLWEARPFSFKADEKYGSEAHAEQLSSQLSAQVEARQVCDPDETVLADIAPMTPKRKRKLRQKNAVFEEEMGESVGLPPPEALTRRKRTRRWD
ncbi:hypothetical protein BGZ68_009227 [Mortierella alpina]|nr:hypothetical protein BGZ68_009227 [Mortierella alpina]